MRRVELLDLAGAYSFEKDGKRFSLRSASMKDLRQILLLIVDNDSDSRGFTKTAETAQVFRGRAEMVAAQEEVLRKLQAWVQDEKLRPDVSQQVKEQLLGVCVSEYVSDSPQEIQDPFNMGPVESSLSLTELQEISLKNSLVVEDEKGRVVGFGRVLDVEGNTELVSLVVDPKYRQYGIGGELIKQRLMRNRSWPLYSFVHVTAESRPGFSLLEYYMKQYDEYQASIPPFDALPEPLKRDLARMNGCFNEYVIIRLLGKAL